MGGVSFYTVALPVHAQDIAHTQDRRLALNELQVQVVLKVVYDSGAVELKQDLHQNM